MKLFPLDRLSVMRNLVAPVFVASAIIGSSAFAEPTRDNPGTRSSAKERTGDKAGTHGNTYGGQQNAGSQDAQNQNRKDHADRYDSGTTYRRATGYYPNDESYRSQHDSADDRKICEPTTKEKGSKNSQAKPTTSELEPRVPQGQPASR